MYFIKNPESRVKNLNKLIKNSYIQYSTSVILQRSIPNIKDGLKPVQRRIVYAMFKEKMFNNRSFEKSAGVVGEVLKNYHPHGDSSVYDSLVRLSQYWVIRYPLVDPQGNFGSLDGDSPAAYRYTECRLSKIAEDLLVDINNGTVNFVLNYKKNLREPEVLPSLIPNLILNGSYGIAVGVTTSIPSHNINETFLACSNLISLGFTKRNALRVLGGPDFPIKSIALKGARLFGYFFNSNESLTLKGCLSVEYLKFGVDFYFRLTVCSLPYNINRCLFLNKVSTLLRGKKFKDVIYLKDSSSKVTNIILFLKKNTYPFQVINDLYKNTGIGGSLSIRMLTLHKKKPSYTSVYAILKTHVNYRVEVLKKNSLYKIKNSTLRINLLKGLKLMFNKVTQALKYIGFLNSKWDLSLFLKKKYGLRGSQVGFILNLKLVQTSNKEKLKILKEYRSVKKSIFYQKFRVSSYSKINTLLKEEFNSLFCKYINPRRSLVVENYRGTPGWISNNKLPPVVLDKEFFIFKTTGGNLLFKEKSAFIASDLSLKKKITDVLSVQLYSNLYIVTSFGYLFLIKNSVKEALILKKILDEGGVCFYFPKEQKLSPRKLIVLTKKGRVLRVDMALNKKSRRKLIDLSFDDEVISCLYVNSGSSTNSILVYTHLGNCIRMRTKNFKLYKGVSKGLVCIRFNKSDYAVSLIDDSSGEGTLLIYADGYVKKNPLGVYKLQGRLGLGVRCSLRNSKLKGCLTVNNSDRVLVTLSSGKNYILNCNVIKFTGKSSRGVRLVKLKNLDNIIGITKI